MEEPYNKREIDAHMREIKALFQEHKSEDQQNFSDIKASIEMLTKEVKKTNGSVRGLQLWRSYMLGGMTVISMMVIPLVIYIYNTAL